LQYVEFEPPAPLRGVIQRVWFLQGDACQLETDLQPVLPDGRPELIVHLGDPFERVEESGQAERQAPLLFAGQLTRQLLLRPTGRIAVAGIRFRADGAAALLDVPQCDLAGLTAPIQDLSPSLHASLCEVRSDTDSPERALCLVLDRLTRRLAGVRPDPRVRAVVDAIDRSRGQITVDALSKRIGLTRRHLERRFQALVGVSPKRLARISRFQHALRVLGDPDDRGRGIRTAAACGYADQAHFIRDFRDLAGCPPGAHLLQRGEITGFFTRQLAPPPLD
jgi:AraC-like DNA-binding protein